MVSTATDPFSSPSSASPSAVHSRSPWQQVDHYSNNKQQSSLFPHKDSPPSLPPSSSSSLPSLASPWALPSSSSSKKTKKPPPPSSSSTAAGSVREVSSRYKSPSPAQAPEAVASRYRSPPPRSIPLSNPSSNSSSSSSVVARRFASPTTIVARISSGATEHHPPSSRSSSSSSVSKQRAVSVEGRRRTSSSSSSSSSASALPSRTSPAATSAAHSSSSTSSSSTTATAAAALPASDSGSRLSAAARSDQLWPSAARNHHLPLPSSSSTVTQQQVAVTFRMSPARDRPQGSRSSNSNSRSLSSSNSGGGSSSSLLPSSDQTLKPPPNSVPSPIPPAPTAQIRPQDVRKKTPERKGMNISPSPLRGRRHSLVDQAENAKPSSDTSLTEPVLRHRWPSSTNRSSRTLKLSHGSSASMSLSMDLTSSSQDQRASLRTSSSSSAASSSTHYMLQSRPTSFSSQVIPRVFSHTVNSDGSAASALRNAARKLSLEAKPRVGSNSRESPLRRGSIGGHNSSTLSNQLKETGNNNINNSSRVNVWPNAERPSSSPEDPSSSSSLPSPLDDILMNAPTMDSCSRVQPSSSSSRVVQKLLSSSLDHVRGEHADSPSPWLGTPTNFSVYKPLYNQLISPIKLLYSSPTRSWSSPLRSRVLSNSLPRITWGSSMVQFGNDSRRSKRALSQVEAAYLHRILHNRLLQWRFVNARADHVNTTQRHAGEKLIFSVWARTAEIRKSVTTKRLKLQQARQARKINSVLRTQGSKLEYWSSIQQEHSTALSGAVEALEAAVLRLPVDEGVKADTQSVKEAMESACEVVNALEFSINLLLPRVEKSNVLISELAQIADQERTLLEECGDLLLIVSSLEVEERSLRMQLLQCEQEKARVLGLLMDSNGAHSGQI